MGSYTPLQGGKWGGGTLHDGHGWYVSQLTSMEENGHRWVHTPHNRGVGGGGGVLVAGVGLAAVDETSCTRLTPSLPYADSEFSTFDFEQL